MFKKVVAWVIMTVMLASPITSYASGLSLTDAFSNLLGGTGSANVNSPGFYQSGARNAFVAGGVELRVPTGNYTAPQLVSVTPPRISAGCNGISLHFGGFSFISGEEFEMLLKSIASGVAMGFVSMLALKVLCPQCEAVVQFLKTMAQKAAELARNACQIGQNMANTFMKSWTSTQSGSSVNENRKNLCGVSVASEGFASDFLSGMGEVCDSVSKAIDGLMSVDKKACDQNGLTGDACDKFMAQSQCSRGEGNVTWQRLSMMDGVALSGDESSFNDVQKANYRRKLMYLNMMGADIYPAPTTTKDGKARMTPGCDTSQGAPSLASPTSYSGKSTEGVFCPRVISEPKQVVGLFMCGAPDANGSYATKLPSGSVAAKYCEDFAGNMKNYGDGLKLYKCDNPTTCDYMKLVDADQVVPGEGFLIQIQNLLNQGVNAVINNKPMPQEVVALMQVAPYPLYQAINSAAVYPASATALLDSMSVLVAEQMAVSFMNSTLRSSGSNSTTTCISSEQAKTIYEFIGSVRAANYSRTAEIGQNLTTQKLLSEQIRSINTTIQQEVLSAEELSTTQTGTALNRAMSGGSSVVGSADNAGAAGGGLPTSGGVQP